MAIVVEEEVKAKGGFGGLIVAVAAIIVLLVAAYYVFVKRPELVDVALPADFEDTVQLSKIDLVPEDVVNNANFRSLQAHVEPSNPSTGGRSNPFLATF